MNFETNYNKYTILALHQLYASKVTKICSISGDSFTKKANIKERKTLNAK